MNEFAELKKRIERLEDIVYAKANSRINSRATFRGGPTEGILALVTEGFFDAPQRKSRNEVMTALVERGKDYSYQAVHIALTRLSKGKKAVLVKHSDQNGINYVKRG